MSDTTLALLLAVWAFLGPIITHWLASKGYLTTQQSEMLEAVISGVEKAGHGPTKMHIDIAAHNAGIETVLDRKVQEHTS